jgi:hypothetical protein
MRGRRFAIRFTAATILTATLFAAIAIPATIKPSSPLTVEIGTLGTLGSDMDGRLPSLGALFMSLRSQVSKAWLLFLYTACDRVGSAPRALFTTIKLARRLPWFWSLHPRHPLPAQGMAQTLGHVVHPHGHLAELTPPDGPATRRHAHPPRRPRVSVAGRPAGGWPVPSPGLRGGAARRGPARRPADRP